MKRKKTIIGYYGPRNCGKSTMLFMLTDLLQGEEIKEDTIQKYKNMDDFKASILYRGHCIVITTRGDSKGDLDTNVEYIKGEDAWDIAVTAGHINGSECEPIEWFKEEDSNVNIKWIRKHKITNSDKKWRHDKKEHEIENKLCARMFFEIIDNIIDKDYPGSEAKGQKGILEDIQPYK